MIAVLPMIVQGSRGRYCPGACVQAQLTSHGAQTHSLPVASLMTIAFCKVLC